MEGATVRDLIDNLEKIAPAFASGWWIGTGSAPTCG